MQPGFSLPRSQPVRRLSFVEPISAKGLPSKAAGDVVLLVDSDATSRVSLLKLLHSSGVQAVGFASVPEFLNYPRSEGAACVLLDARTSDFGSLELLRQLKEQAGPPVIFLSTSPNIADTVCAMRAGALEFFEKPVNPDALLAAIHVGFQQDRKVRQREEDLARLKARLTSLTPREREVLPLVIGGLLNKQAASILGISEVTLQIHRSQIMRKMGANSVAELVRMAVKLRVPHRRESEQNHSASEKSRRSGVQCWEPRLVAS